MVDGAAPEDDKSIPAEEVLYRRVTAEQVHSDAGGAMRVASNAFRDSSNSPCSIVLGSKLAELGRPPESVLRRYENRCGLVRFTAADARACGFGVLRSPVADEPAHGYLTGRKSHGPCKQLGKRAVIVIPPPSRG